MRRDKPSGYIERSNGPQIVGSFAHPASLFCLGAWILNDHILKDTFGNVVTGKLSDIFGLVVFPLLVASLLPRSISRRIDWALAATAIFFTAINLSAVASGGIESVFGPLLTNPQLTPDPTDLLCLPCLLGARWIWSSALPVDSRFIATLGRAVFASAIVASLATSQGPVTSERAITRVEVFDSAFVALHQQILLDPGQSADAEELSGDPNPALGAPRGLGATVYRSLDGRSWEQTMIDPNVIDWQQTLDDCVGDLCIQVSGNLFDRGSIGSLGIGVVFEPIERPPGCYDAPGSDLSPLTREDCDTRSVVGPLDIAIRDNSIAVVALGTEGVATFDGESWTQIAIDTPGPRPWHIRNFATLVWMGLAATLWLFALLGVIAYRRRYRDLVLDEYPEDDEIEEQNDETPD